jgi:DNA-binding transcriptional ArsR family regulator
MSLAWPFPKSWRALVRPRRVDVLRLLRERPHTPTELSKRLAASPSTIRDDLRVLTEAGLVLRRDAERVWAYHELTPAGRSLAEAGPLLPVLAASIFAFGAMGAALAIWVRQPDPMPFGSMPASAPDPLFPWLVAAVIILALVGALFVAVALALKRRRGLPAAARTGSD